MDKEKIKIKKHDHRLTDLLKVSIFSLVMMAPIAAIGITCAYVICNKNAYQSYYGKNINEVEIHSVSSFNQDDTYYWKSNLYTNLFSDINNNLAVNELISFTTNQPDTTFDLSLCTDIKFLNNGTTNPYVSFRGVNNTILKNVAIQGYALEFSVDVQPNNTYVNDQIKSFFYTKTYNKNSYLDNVFYYAVDTMQNNTLFSWTKTTAIYTGVETMTTGLGITTASVPVLLTYWFLITVIYVIIDIVITMFTWITHLIGER